ncbi:hypothetical protein NX81_017050 [Xanthomonas vasicola]|nr:hypothetical protein NX81_017050 [Xanthomonas vasicola]
MKMPTLLSMSLLAALSLPAAAQTAPPQDVPFDGTLKIDVDATDLAHRIFKVKTTMPAKPGSMTLLYPQWIPGNHSPTGPIDKLAGLVIKVDGKVVPWKRDQFPRWWTTCSIWPRSRPGASPSRRAGSI